METLELGCPLLPLRATHGPGAAAAAAAAKEHQQQLLEQQKQRPLNVAVLR
jgi:hypothetical protein